ncbi:MAG: helix-turn-helix transcriptional regulator [Alphaproteobacteria bacterium]|nr:MAG: helix-turn-helix transcriptional regulator [Alphaproteobacteria bacterium]
MSVLGKRVRIHREAHGLSQEDLAKKVGVKQATIDKIERGLTVRTRFLPEIAAALYVKPQDLINPRTEFPIPGPQPVNLETDILPAGNREHGDLPVYASAQGGPGEMLITYDPIDYVTRPEPLASVRDGYAMYVVGDSMSPAFEQGDLIMVNPHVPYRPTDDVAIFKKVNGESAAIVKRLVRATADQWTLMQFTPAKTFSLSRKEWPQCHVIVGKYSRR